MRNSARRRYASTLSGRHLSRSARNCCLYDKKLEFVDMRWGFPPPEGEKKLCTNTRRLRLAFWRDWLEPKYRCLIPYTSFAEWIEGPNGKMKEMWFAPASGQLGYIAGIWRPWTGTRGTKAEPVTGDHLLFSFLTSKPNSEVKAHHDRMPVILANREAQIKWLRAPSEAVKSFKNPAPVGHLVILPDDNASTRPLTPAAQGSLPF